MDSHSLLIMVELAIVVGLASFVLADRVGLPPIVLLLFVGILVGPEVLGLVDPVALGDGLRVIVSIAVGIIVFEGGMLLDLHEMRAASPPIRNLMTIGVAVSVAGGTLAAWLIAGLSLQLALLFGALMSVTGPTVITPLLKRANVNNRLQTILQSEAVLVDAIGAVLAVVVLELIIDSPTLPLAETVRGVFIRLGVGTLIGLVGGYLLVLLLRQLRTSPAGVVRLAALGGALSVFTVAEIIVPEAGIAAVALAGIVLGNGDIPYRHQIESFKGDLTNLGIAMLFILLAARLRFETLFSFGLGGWGGILAVVAMMVLVRPASVFASMFGTSVPRKERLYIASLGPRGVVAASLAAFAEFELSAHGYEGVSGFVGLVFLTIIGTVVLQGLYARPLARRLGVINMHILIISADAIGRELAQRLIGNDASVTLMDTDIVQVETARRAELTAIQGNGTDTDDLKRANIENTSVFVAATSSDRTNLLACQIAMQRFEIKDVVARVNKPENVENFTSLGIRVVSPVISTAILLDNLVRRPGALELLTSQLPEQLVIEAELVNRKLAGKSLRDWGLQKDVLVVLVRRGDQLFVPHGTTVMQTGDILTLIASPDEAEHCRTQIETG
ncbi:MAG: cation:proton antiporter [Anaerolineaceae bacterium]|nr:cation:proton antiporter [Anaerolineaceae bacterium]